MPVYLIEGKKRIFPVLLQKTFPCQPTITGMIVLFRLMSELKRLRAVFFSHVKPRGYSYENQRLSEERNDMTEVFPILLCKLVSGLTRMRRVW